MLMRIYTSHTLPLVQKNSSPESNPAFKKRHCKRPDRVIIGIKLNLREFILKSGAS